MAATTAPEVTIVDEPERQRFEGQWLGTRLVTDALSEVRGAGLAVLPFCPFVRAFIANHTGEYLDLVPEGYHSKFGLPAND
jgi:predicted GNAT family acetyltransferase